MGPFFVPLPALIRRPEGRKPQMKRLKIKAKKFVFYKLILSSNNENAAATVTSADIRVRYTGYAK